MISSYSYVIVLYNFFSLIFLLIFVCIRNLFVVMLKRYFHGWFLLFFFFIIINLIFFFSLIIVDSLWFFLFCFIAWTCLIYGLELSSIKKIIRTKDSDLRGLEQGASDTRNEDSVTTLKSHSSCVTCVVCVCMCFEGWR